MAMKNKTKTPGVKRVKLALDKETVASLTGDMLKRVVGGAIPLSHSGCDSHCIEC
jgi:hypothetical protein